MTIENAKVLQERLADEAIAQVQVKGSKELADACIHSTAIARKARGIPADETANRQTHAQEEQTRRVSYKLFRLIDKHFSRKLQVQVGQLHGRT